MSNPQQAVTRCPRCNRFGVVQGTLNWCRHCSMAYDDDPDEGGDFDDRDPSRRLERNERRQSRRR